jgi:hypothetical protein
VFAGVGVDEGDCGECGERCGDGEWMIYWEGEGRGRRHWADDWQERSATISLAVLSIYAVDFAINAGKGHNHSRRGYG